VEELWSDGLPEEECGGVDAARRGVGGSDFGRHVVVYDQLHKRHAVHLHCVLGAGAADRGPRLDVFDASALRVGRRDLRGASDFQFRPDFMGSAIL
jgi:hypothetical protein